MTETDVRESCNAALLEVLADFGDTTATAEVLQRVAAVPVSSDLTSYVQAVAEIARQVWERKVTTAAQRVRRLEELNMSFTASRHLPQSQHVH